MKSLLSWTLLGTVSLLVGCQFLTSPAPVDSTLLTTREIAPEPTSTNESQPEALSTAPVATVTPPPEMNSILPDPGLFDVPWEDRELFRAGLVQSEQEVLSGLPGATTYHLTLKIGESLTAIDGREEVLYTNRENVPLDDIYFHLFPNLLGGAMTIGRISLNGDAVSPEFVSADYVMRLPLAEPLEPGSQVVISIDFLTSVPTRSERNYGIFVYTDGVLALAHAYPMVAVYDEEGWHVDPPVAEGDVVYADASFYLVKVNSSAGERLVTSGIEVSREEDGDRQNVVFAAGPTRDFYLASSDRYSVLNETIGETVINSYAPTEFSEAAAATLDYAAQALESFNRRFGPYPYTELDIVATPTLALGVEYPGLFVNAQRLYDLSMETRDLPNRLLLESTTVHETGHQWFYNIVGNNQLEEPWLDEALAQYATWQYYVDRYGEREASGFYQSFVGRWNRVEQADIPIGLPVSAYQGAEYGAIVYGRGPIFVNELAETMGQAAFSEFMRQYFRAFRWGIVTTEAFQYLAEQSCQCDLTPLFSAWVLAP